MCGRYLVITEDEIIEMKSILEELNQRFSDLDDNFWKNKSPLSLSLSKSVQAKEGFDGTW